MQTLWTWSETVFCAPDKSLHYIHFLMQMQENTWNFTSWLWNFLYDCDTPGGFFMGERFFYYYHLKFVYNSLIGLTYSGKYDTVDQKLSFGNDILTTLNFQVRDLDLHSMGGDEDVTEKNFGLIHITR